MSSSTFLSYQSNYFFFFHAITNQSHAVEGELCRVEFIHELLSSESSAKKRKKIPQLTYFLTRSNTLTKLVVTTHRQAWWQTTQYYLLHSSSLLTTSIHQKHSLSWQWWNSSSTEEEENAVLVRQRFLHPSHTNLLQKIVCILQVMNHLLAHICQKLARLTDSCWV